ncbi:MAG: TonB-dependent receptor plug domain-containing protein [Prevotella sp.]|uniref:TonB-dependent receptor n=1 Tax=Prevotella sp. TaxID=59823 RepID=UPI002A30D4C7|nr:TonB-dependent receptor plug domain-containing protein [Prevotella sp.]MDD7317834.1 TonB-dependent receptor plug domain-containing protein [Prevotellaceae bacterium]MDY4020749.1 TonB-dependent receptor plug domain-containing protein [Prevotella sp.]
MKKSILTVAAMIAATAGTQEVLAQQSNTDSLRMEELQEVVVRGVKAQKGAPFAVENIKRKELSDFSKTGKELPFLFSQTPGVLAWSENGMGTGTSYMRIRGAGGSRINVTLDGVPLNSPEDQCVFWANMNSYATLLGNVQIQRGVGTSTNGDGAFGGTIAMSSKSPSHTPMLELNASYGSHNTFNVGTSFSTGVLWNHFIFDGAYHETNTDGFIHGTEGRSGSYYGGLSWIGKDFVIRYKNIGNFEKTGQAWNGVTAGDDDMSLMDGMFGGSTGITTYKDMYNAGLGRFNSLYEHLVYDANGNFAKDENGNYITERHKMRDGSLWRKTTDNFRQNHNILSAAWEINDNWSMSGSLHYTHGYGYYNEFRYNNKLKKFGLSFTKSDGTTLKKTDFVRKKGLSQDAYGMVWNMNFKNDDWDVVGGLSLQQFSGNHFGYLTYIADEELEAAIMQNGKYKYYDSDAKKFDGNVFAKAVYHINPMFDVFADMQYRHVGYKTDGCNDKFYEKEDGYVNQLLNIDKKYDFFNPKAGLSFHKNGHNAYASVALSHREPERNNFTDNGSYPAPVAETLTDYELGYSYFEPGYHFGINLFYMDYKDQFVQTGAESDIGEALTTNIKDSYRMGMEMTLGCDVTSWLSLEANMALSSNKVKDFDEVVEDWEKGTRTIHYDNSTLAFSPSMIANAFINFHWKGLQAVIHSQSVSRQYLDNTKNKARSMPSYEVVNANITYTLSLEKKLLGLKEVTFGAHLNNITNRHYAQSGWVYSAISEKNGHTNDNRYYQIGFVPSAGFTAMGSISLRF